MTAAVTVAQSGAPGVSLGFKNRIINGGMTIDQRYAGASVAAPTNGQYVMDRWSFWTQGTGVYSVVQSTDAPPGFSNSALLTVTTADASVATTDYYVFSQCIEGFNTSDMAFGTANAKTVTVSFWVKASVTGTFSGSLRNSAGDYAYPFQYTISSASTWEYKTVTIPGATAGTWLGATNGIGMRLWLGIGTGPTYTAPANAWVSKSGVIGADSSTNLISTLGATFYITGVQLEVGTAATQFEFRDYGRELIMCQRYFWQNPNTYYYYKSRELDRNRVCSIPFPVTMRTAPTITKVSDPAGFTWTWVTPSVQSVPGSGTAPSDGYTDFTGVMQASAEL